jgi:XTP/dITP diphosphohydrolase
MPRLILATRNRHKAIEIQALLGSDFKCQSLLDHPDAPNLVEDADTFEANATRKAGQLAQWLSSRISPGLTWVLADDSGLEVDALDGAPGVFSARFAAPSESGNATDAANNAKLLRALNSVPEPQRTARFRCAIALIPVADHQCGSARVFTGTCEGRIASAPHGTNGFGYDPLFIPSEHDRSFAQLSDLEKNAISHRARALAALKAFIATRPLLA